MDPRSNLIVVCGLGRLGLACLRILLQFNTTLRCLDQTPPPWRDGDGLAALGDDLVIGDMRDPEALMRAGGRVARAVLLVSSDSGLNLEAALQVRLLNPSARVVRSNGSLELERHLRERLPGLALVDPELLTAASTAAAHGEATGCRTRAPVGGSHWRASRSPWTRACEGGPGGTRGSGAVRAGAGGWLHPLWIWLSTAGLLLTIALLKGEYIDALSAMTGGGPLEADQLGLAALSLAFALGGTLFTAWLVAVILDWLLARRLGRREPGPLSRGTSYVLVIGGHRLARILERLLAQSRFRVRRVAPDGLETGDQVFRSLDRALRVLRHGRCQGVAVLGDDLMANLETALTLQDQWPQARLAVQSHSLSRGAELGRLFPGMSVINPLELAAEAVVATAFGERVREVLRVADTNLLLTDYRVEAGDSLVGRSLGQIAEGYGVTPASLTLSGQTKALMLPRLDRVMQPGDALLVLAALPGLRAVEAGRMQTPGWQLELRGMGVGADGFEAQMLLARHLNRPPGDVAIYLDCRQESRLSPPLPQGQGRELEAGLRRLGIQCSLVPCGEP